MSQNEKKAYSRPELTIQKIELGVYGKYIRDDDRMPFDHRGGRGGGHHGGFRGFGWR